LPPVLGIEEGTEASALYSPSRETPKAQRYRRILRRVFVLVLIAFIIRTFIGEAALVPTSSMEGTILVGDHIILNKLAYGPELPFLGWKLPRMRRPQRGNIIAFHYPKDPSLNFLKRVIAVGGDVVEIRDSIVYVNGIPRFEPYAVHKHGSWIRHEDMRPRYVPYGELFVLGDNRDNSDDSRYWGTVPEQNVIGEPLMIVWSYDAPTSEWLNERPGAQLKLYASIAVGFFAHTRWSRTGILL
jgi:signal peptidase I